ncbi:MAG: hypothetical protein ACT4NJ_07450, partial [Nitrosopumilaceae archaeon]
MATLESSRIICTEAQDIFIQKLLQSDYIFLIVIWLISALTIPKILWMFFVFIIFSSSLIDFAFAQNDVTIQDE